MDRYAIGVTPNSCSTMHKIMSKKFTPEMFECKELTEDSMKCLLDYIDKLNELRNRYLVTKDKKTWKDLIILLPSSWLQMRTKTMNYEVLYSIAKQRAGHKLTEWADFLNWMKTLPYAEELIFCR